MSLKFYSNSNKNSKELSEIITERTEVFKERERKYSTGSTLESSFGSSSSQ